MKILREIVSCNKELSKRERIMLKDISNALSLEEAANMKTEITPVVWSEIKYTTEEKTYSVFVVLDKAGEKYKTSSNSFWNTFNEIADEMWSVDDPEEFTIRVNKKESRNYSGKYYITCSLV